MHLRTVATRYDKLDIAYLCMVFIAAIYLWLKSIPALSRKQFNKISIIQRAPALEHNDRVELVFIFAV